MRGAVDPVVQDAALRGWLPPSPCRARAHDPVTRVLAGSENDGESERHGTFGPEGQQHDAGRDGGDEREDGCTGPRRR